MTIIIETPQPPVRERLMRVPDGAVRVVKGDVFDPVDRLYVKEDAEVRDATPADMERAGWVPRSALDTQVEATLSNIRRAGHLERERDEARCLYEAAHCERMRITDVLQRVERERDEARDTIARARGCITDVPAGVRNALDIEVARLLRERDEARAERDKLDAKLAQAEERGDLADQRAIDAIAERDEARLGRNDALQVLGQAREALPSDMRGGWLVDAVRRLVRERDEARDTIARARGCITDVPAGVRNALDVEVARVVRERDEAVRSRDQARAALAAWQGSAEQERARIVRDAWVAWAHEQPSPRPGWLVPWDEMPEGPDKEVDRRIGDAVAERLLGEVTP